MQLDGSPELVAWLTAQRQRFRSTRVAVLSELTTRAPADSDEIFQHLQPWLQLSPFDQSAHELMLEALLKRGRMRDADEHVAATIGNFEREGLDWSPLREAWRRVRGKSLAPVATRSLLLPAATTLVEPLEIADKPVRRRASIAVMPFRDETSPGHAGRPIADGLTEDVILRLARLRVLFVIARGTAYVLGERGIDAQEAGRILNVDYVASGYLRNKGGQLKVLVELSETQGAHLVWSEEIAGVTADAGSMFDTLDAIVNRIVCAIAEEIEAAECNRAMLKPPSSLDAWEAYHRGLWHMYKFNGPDNLHAGRFFRAALELDPTFSRAYSGLSFTLIAAMRRESSWLAFVHARPATASPTSSERFVSTVTRSESFTMVRAKSASTRARARRHGNAVDSPERPRVKREVTGERTAPRSWPGSCRPARLRRARPLVRSVT